MAYEPMLDINAIVKDERATAQLHKSFMRIVLWAGFMPIAILLVRPEAVYSKIDYGWIAFPLLLVMAGVLLEPAMAYIVGIKRVDDRTLQKLAEVEFQSNTAFQNLQGELKDAGSITINKLEKILILESNARTANITDASQTNSGAIAILHKVVTKSGTGQIGR